MNHPYRRFIMRPRKGPGIPLPVGARSVGEACVARGYEQQPGARAIVEMIWVVSGQADITINGQRSVLKPEHVISLYPNDVYDLVAISEQFWFYWLTLDGKSAGEIARLFDLSRVPQLAGSVPEDDFNQLFLEIGDITPLGEKKACATALRIIIRAGKPSGIEAKEKMHPIVKKALALIEHNVMYSELSLNWLATQLGRDRSSFSRLFTQVIGLSPSNYIISLRMQQALKLLRTTSLTVAEVARRCGYSDPNYFSTAFKKTYGHTATHLRHQS